MDEIIDAIDMQDIVKFATKEFQPDLVTINRTYITRVDYIISLLNTLQADINSSIRQRGRGSMYYRRGAEFETQLTAQDNQIYTRLTQLYYLMRTYLTGETIKFLEEIDGHLKVIDQEDWLNRLSGGTTGQISLLEKDIASVGKSLSESEDFSILTRQSESIINEVIEAATFRWEDEKATYKQLTNYRYMTAKQKLNKDFDNAHRLYQKHTRDTWVYAYYTGGNIHQLQLVYNKEKPYNLGQLQEEIFNKLENTVTIADQLALINNLQNSEHPVDFVLAGWKANVIPGTVEGDIKTKYKQWIQSKRHNERVISTLQAHRVTVKMKALLIKLRNSLTQGNNEQIIAQLTDEFYSMFSSERKNIDYNLKKKIGQQLQLLGQPIV